MGLAIIVPVLMPWAGTSLFKGSGGEGGSGSGGGGGNVSQLNPTVQLGGWLTARTETTLLKFTSTDTNPEYLRAVTLDTFDGRAWKWKQAAQKPAGSARDVPAGPLDGAPGSDVQTDVNIIGLSQVWLPVPYPGGSIDGLTGGWAYDGDTLDVFGTGSSSTHGQQYSVVSRPDEPTAVELQGASPAPDDLEAKYTALPDDIPASVRQLTQQIMVGASNEYDKALALQQFFISSKNHFTYTTTPDLPGNNPLVAFLTKRQGFCQQFAGAYAVMARLAGLPTRIEIGFTPGTSDRTGTYTVTNKNAHAWPEVYFSGYGWVRFEPTASAPAGVAQPDYAPDPNKPAPGSAAQGEHSGPNTRLEQDLTNDQGAAAAAATSRTRSRRARRPTPRRSLGSADRRRRGRPAADAAVVRVVRRRRRLSPVPAGMSPDEVRDRVRVAWLEVAETAIDLHDMWPAARTPRRTADWVAGLGLPADASTAGYRLARVVERSRYAPDGVDVLAGTDPASDARQVCRALEAAATRRERWRARFVPVSVLARLSERSADVLDWLDELGARTRSRLRRIVQPPGRDRRLTGADRRPPAVARLLCVSGRGSPRSTSGHAHKSRGCGGSGAGTGTGRKQRTRWA